MSYLLMLVLCFVLSLTLITVFFAKKSIVSGETTIYKILIITNLIGIVLEMLSIYFTNKYLNTHVTTAIVKFYFIYIITYLTILLFYAYEICQNDSKNRSSYIIYKKISFIIYFLSIIALFFLPFEQHKGYATGTCVDFIYLYSSILFTAFLIIFFINRKNGKIYKIFPLLLLGLMMLVLTFIQKYNPEFTISTAVHFLTVFIMYFTIENPDVKMIEQLNIARDQAEKANNAKSDFLSSMSHEIRTPLNAIVGFSQALSEEELPMQAKEEVKDIMMASETLLDIVNGILDISKIEANKLEIVNTEYSFNTVLEELVSLTKARLGEKPLDFRYSFSPDIPKYMYGDKVRVKQVILNLLTNAVKYTHEGWIEFKVNCVNRDGVCRLIISVQDTGIGIKQDSINKLFNRFERLDIEKNNTIEGTGLGLAITKKLIELMGGQIVVQSVYGEGSKFTVAIDQRIVENPTNPNLEKTQVMDLSAIKNIDLTNRRILVVDDNKINLKVASRLLQDYHCIIDTIDSGIEAFEKIKMGATYDLILMDDMMPKQSGIETLHKLKELEGFNMPVVALTANAISGMKEKYLSEGFNDYLSKPIDKTELNRVLNKFIK